MLCKKLTALKNNVALYKKQLFFTPFCSRSGIHTFVSYINYPVRVFCDENKTPLDESISKLGYFDREQSMIMSKLNQAIEIGDFEIIIRKKSYGSTTPIQANILVNSAGLQHERVPQLDISDLCERLNTLHISDQIVGISSNKLSRKKIKALRRISPPKCKTILQEKFDILCNIVKNNAKVIEEKGVQTIDLQNCLDKLRHVAVLNSNSKNNFTKNDLQDNLDKLLEKKENLKPFKEKQLDLCEHLDKLSEKKENVKPFKEKQLDLREHLDKLHEEKKNVKPFKEKQLDLHENLEKLHEGKVNVRDLEEKVNTYNIEIIDLTLSDGEVTPKKSTPKKRRKKEKGNAQERLYQIRNAQSTSQTFLNRLNDFGWTKTLGPVPLAKPAHLLPCDGKYAFLNRLMHNVVHCNNALPGTRFYSTNPEDQLKSTEIPEVPKEPINELPENTKTSLKPQRSRTRKAASETPKSAADPSNISPETSKTTAETSSTTSKLSEYVYGKNILINPEINKMFPFPKSILNNIHQMLLTELKHNNLKLTSKYKQERIAKNRILWNCTYTLHWPEDLKFIASDYEKKQSSHKAAICALSYLYQNGKITRTGQPILYDKNEVKLLKTQSLPEFALKSSESKTMWDINEIFDKEFSTILENVEKSVDGTNINNNTLEDNENDKENILSRNTFSQRFLGLETYSSKEKVHLPISDYKPDLIKLIKENRVLIVKGEPGCGKSTRVPQYVLELWAKEAGTSGEPCQIAVTQPRRIAAISLAERVSSERNESVGNIVGYQVRLKSAYNKQTGRVLYCTTGILLRHLQSDPNLKNFSHVILDEAHERDVNTDLLMNLLRTALTKNDKLKVIVMSATIDTDVFQNYFEDAAIINIPGFTHPVKSFYLDDIKKVNLSKTEKMSEGEAPNVVAEDVLNVLQFIHKNKPEGAILVFLPGWEDIKKVRNLIPNVPSLAVHCLHSRLQDSEQWKIFTRPPNGVRKIILATNIAETSVTIDDVVYVVDTGIHKENRFDIEKGINVIDNHWVSKASAIQRRGRAGRVRPGESYHLYPKSKYDECQDYSMPEIMRTSLTKIVLDTKVFSNNMNAVQFMSELLTPPDKSATRRAVDELKELELLDENENLTSIGRTVADFQLEPKLAKAMVNAVVYKCTTPIVDIVTLFSAETDLFASSLMNKDAIKSVKKQFCPDSDHIAMMRIFEKWLEFVEENDQYMCRKFVNETNLVPHKLELIKKLRSIHFDYLYDGLYDVLPISDDFSDNDELVKAVLFSGVGNVLKHRNWDIVKNKLKKNVHVLLTRYNHKASISNESVNFKRFNFPSNYLMYINETRSNIRRTTTIRESSLINNLTVLLFSNKEIDIKEVEKENYSSNIASDDQVKLYLKKTNVEFICDRKHAEDVVKCKNALNSVYQYYINELTNGGEYSKEANICWDKMLALLNKLFAK